MKKILGIVQGVAINVGFMLFGFAMLYMFYFLFCWQSPLIVQNVV